jgi:hypothetical protein
MESSATQYAEIYILFFIWITNLLNLEELMTIKRFGKPNFPFQVYTFKEINELDCFLHFHLRPLILG